MTAKYNHAFSFSFSLNTDNKGDAVTPNELRQAILGYLASFNDWELIENCGMPFDTYLNEEIE
jgi:hypothetical protein